METKFSKLAQLRSLFESGALTKEEFEAARERLFATVNPESAQSPYQTASRHSDEGKSTSGSVSNKWILLGVGCLIVIAVIIMTVMDNDEEKIPTDTDPALALARAEEEGDAYMQQVMDNMPKETEEEIFERYNPWSLDYFKNEWGEIDSSNPMLYTTLSGTGWDIHVDYIPITQHNPDESFRFYILDSDSIITTMDGPVNIIVRGSNGVTCDVPVTGVRNSIAFIEDPSTVAGLKMCFDKEDFDIKMEFDKYNERHATQARWTSPGFLVKSIENML